MKQILKALLLLPFLGIISCGYNQSNKGLAPEAEMAQFAKREMQSSDAVNDDISIERKLIKEGEISFETSNAKETKQIVHKAIEENKGYISNDNVFDYKDKVEYRIVIRVPAVNFDLLLDNISEHADRIDNKTINVLDVTEEFIDIEARLKTKKELENRYRDLLEKANKVEDLIAIEKEMGNLRSEIESIEGRLKYLQKQVSFSTLTVTFYERTSSEFGFNSKLLPALKNGWSNLLRFIIGLANLWPFLVAGLIGLLLITQLNKRKKTTVPKK